MSRGYKQGSINLAESLTYDNLERLTSSTISGRSPVNITYASNGNILSKTGVGSYYYNEYKINAVDSIINNPGSIPVTTQEINYTSFNKVSEITDSLNENSIRLYITYGPDQQRIRNIFYRNDTIIKTKYYSIDYEKDSTSAAVKQIYYINCPYGLVAINIRQNGTDSLYFPDTDHLGSILALVRNNGSEAEKFSYDAWGRRRNPTDWTYDNIPSSTIIDRGYTGHEHYDLFGLIDMNGRVYDPVMGRFLSPDPVLQSPEFTQGYNGYSYCINNPLRFIDPTGYNKDEPLWQKIKALLKKIFGKNDGSDTDSSNEAGVPDQQSDQELNELAGLSWLPLTFGGNPNSISRPFSLPNVEVRPKKSTNELDFTPLFNSLRNTPTFMDGNSISFQANYFSADYYVPISGDKITFEVSGKYTIGDGENNITFKNSETIFRRQLGPHIIVSFTTNLGIQTQYNLKNYSLSFGASPFGVYSYGYSTGINGYTQTIGFTITLNQQSRLEIMKAALFFYFVPLQIEPLEPIIQYSIQLP